MKSAKVPAKKSLAEKSTKLEVMLAINSSIFNLFLKICCGCKTRNPQKRRMNKVPGEARGPH